MELFFHHRTVLIDDKKLPESVQHLDCVCLIVITYVFWASL